MPIDSHMDESAEGFHKVVLESFIVSTRWITRPDITNLDFEFHKSVILSTIEYLEKRRLENT